VTLVVRLLESFAAIPPAEWLAVVLAFAYLVLAVRQNPWCWASAAVSSAIYLVLFARGGLIMQSALQVFYIAMAAYGWYAWRGGGDARAAPLAVSTWTPRTHSLAIGAALLATAVNGWLLAPAGGGAVPYVDALVAWVSVLATWMVARKVLENWLYWIVIDLVAAGLYWTQGFHATTALFLVYVAIAVRGFQAWRADLVVVRAAREAGTSA
jgi:nicotinamide mononucleotide transporter